MEIAFAMQQDPKHWLAYAFDLTFGRECYNIVYFFGGGRRWGGVEFKFNFKFKFNLFGFI